MICEESFGSENFVSGCCTDGRLVSLTKPLTLILVKGKSFESYFKCFSSLWNYHQTKKKSLTNIVIMYALRNPCK